jgi:triacylglycerol lipase
VEDAGGDSRNARCLAAACQFAYYPSEKGTQAFADELGLTAKLVSVDNTQAYIGQNENHIVVAFRGSEEPTSLDGLKDWLLTNAMNLLIQPQGPLGADFAAAGVGARFHQGFVSALSEIWDPVYSEVDGLLKEKDRPLWVTGHSLGGALAVLASWLFLRKTINVHQVYTFGAPMVGNKDAAEAINREFGGKLSRYANAPDPVPLLPMMSLIANDYSHCDTLHPLGEGGEANAAEFVKGLAGDAASAVLSGTIADKFWNSLKGRIAAHLLDDYRKLL